MNPICKEFDIYDIFHNSQLIIITPYILTPHTIEYGSLLFELHKCPHNHTFIYTLDVEYASTILLKINGIPIETHVNKYPTFKDEIIFSTIVKDEDSYLIPWIEFHLKIGITRFIIYDNSNRNTLSTVLLDYIQRNIVLLINWNYPYRTKLSGISGQTTQQNHSIYAFRDSKYIGLFDIDEYVNIKGIKNIHSFFEELIQREKIEIDNIGSFRLLNKFFYNPYNLPTENGHFLNIPHCDKITLRGHEKTFVLPKNVITYSVHAVTSGKPTYSINPNCIYFNHYYYLNKQNRGRNKTPFIDSSIVE